MLPRAAQKKILGYWAPGSHLPPYGGVEKVCTTSATPSPPRRTLSKPLDPLPFPLGWEMEVPGVEGPLGEAAHVLLGEHGPFAAAVAA